MCKEEVARKIYEKELELHRLKEGYNNIIEKEKATMLKSKSKGMSKSLYLLGFNFESSSGRTSQYLEFHRVFKKEFSTLLKPYIQKIEVSEPNHFDVSGFFEMKDGRVFYFNIGDLRWDKDSMLIRSAKGFKDYTGGRNNGIRVDNKFADSLIEFITTRNMEDI